MVKESEGWICNMKDSLGALYVPRLGQIYRGGQIERSKVYMLGFRLCRRVRSRWWCGGVGQIRGMWGKSRLGRWMTDSKQGMPLKLAAQQRQGNMRSVCVWVCGESQRVFLISYTLYCQMYFSYCIQTIIKPYNRGCCSNWVPTKVGNHEMCVGKVKGCWYHLMEAAAMDGVMFGIFVFCDGI